MVVSQKESKIELGAEATGAASVVSLAALNGPVAFLDAVEVLEPGVLSQSWAVRDRTLLRHVAIAAYRASLGPHHHDVSFELYMFVHHADLSVDGDDEFGAGVLFECVDPLGDPAEGSEPVSALLIDALVTVVNELTEEQFEQAGWLPLIPKFNVGDHYELWGIHGEGSRTVVRIESSDAVFPDVETDILWGHFPTHPSREGTPHPAVDVSTCDGYFGDEPFWERAAVRPALLVTRCGPGALPPENLETEPTPGGLPTGPWWLVEIAIVHEGAPRFRGVGKKDPLPSGLVAFDPTISLDDLRSVFEVLFDRDDDHLWELVGERCGTVFARPDLMDLDDSAPHRCGDPVSHFLAPGDRFWYLNDYGDEWRHAGRVLGCGVDPGALELECDDSTAAIVRAPKFTFDQYRSFD